MWWASVYVDGGREDGTHATLVCVWLPGVPACKAEAAEDAAHCSLCATPGLPEAPVGPRCFKQTISALDGMIVSFICMYMYLC